MKHLNKYRILFFFASALVLYSLIGGLTIKLKPGISAVDKTLIKSDSIQFLGIELYNCPEEIKINRLVVVKKDLLWETPGSQLIRKDKTLTSPISINLGKASSGLCDVLLEVETKENTPSWMYFPQAFWIEKSMSDTLSTGNGKVATLEEISSSGELKLIDEVEFGFPNRSILNESIRNLLYHVPMWFSMIFLLGVSAVASILYLRKGDMFYDLLSDSFLKIGILNGILGCLTGAAWARVTWQSWWPAEDPKLNGVAIGMSMYLAYLILRSSIQDPYQKARISSVYSVLIYPIFMALIAIMPKLTEGSLHPGSGGSVGFNQYDLDNTLRMFFYPAILGWIGVFSWIAIMRIRIKKLEELTLEQD